MNIRGLDKARVLKALCNRASCGVTTFTPGGMTDAQARELMAQAGPSYTFDYVHGRALKVSLRGDQLDTALFNREHGSNAAEEAVQKEFLEGGA